MKEQCFQRRAPSCSCSSSSGSLLALHKAYKLRCVHNLRPTQLPLLLPRMPSLWLAGLTHIRQPACWRSKQQPASLRPRPQPQPQLEALVLVSGLGSVLCPQPWGHLATTVAR